VIPLRVRPPPRQALAVPADVVAVPREVW